MLSLLRSEWYQVRKSLSLKITFGIVLAASVMFGIKLTDTANLSEYRKMNLVYTLYGGGAICNHMSDGAMALLLASLFAGWMIGGSFENRVIQESISYGKKRSTVYLAKMFMYSLVVTALCLVYWCVTTLPTGYQIWSGHRGHLRKSMPCSLHDRNGCRRQHSIYQHIYGLRRDRILRAKNRNHDGYLFCRHLSRRKSSGIVRF